MDVPLLEFRLLLLVLKHSIHACDLLKAVIVYNHHGVYNKRPDLFKESVEWVNHLDFYVFLNLPNNEVNQYEIPYICTQS